MSEDERISAGLYIGRGPKPKNVDAGMYVDMTGRNVGVYISAGQPQTLGDILEQALRDNPKHASELRSFIQEVKTTSRENVKPLLQRIVDWGKANPATLTGAALLLLKVANTVLTQQ